ncbi:hypothetical protein [Lentzea sp. NBRC 105346]|uniref:hypothetical protein n=1 Tax=Lentzea sp. NBRC 105346 TaxID=3032205 RepID=UPI0025537566|nr:hypothetical protein [Lentzea sp. NBRC 105346]
MATLEDMGVPSRTSYRRCLPGGPWRRLLPGVVLLQNAPPTAEQLVQAALVYGGRRAIITGREACRRHGMRDVTDDQKIHVLVPHEQRLRSEGFLVVERTRRLPLPVLRDGVPLAPVARAVLDSCRTTKDEDLILRLLVQAIQWKNCTPELLSTELERGSTRGTALPRRLLTDAVLVRSVAEKDALDITRQAGVPTDHWNKRLFTLDGQYVGTPDAWWDDVGLAWEIDSTSFHYDREGYERTLDRNARYAAAGVLVLQTLPSRLRTDRAAVIRELLSAHRAASATPRPPVVLMS